MYMCAVKLSVWFYVYFFAGLAGRIYALDKKSGFSGYSSHELFIGPFLTKIRISTLDSHESFIGPLLTKIGLGPSVSMLDSENEMWFQAGYPRQVRPSP